MKWILNSFLNTYFWLLFLNIDLKNKVSLFQTFTRCARSPVGQIMSIKHHRHQQIGERQQSPIVMCNKKPSTVTLLPNCPMCKIWKPTLTVAWWIRRPAKGAANLVSFIIDRPMLPLAEHHCRKWSFVFLFDFSKYVWFWEFSGQFLSGYVIYDFFLCFIWTINVSAS